MKVYKVAVRWSVEGVVRIGADSLQRAVEVACLDAITADHPYYVDGSHTVNKEYTKELNEEG